MRSDHPTEGIGGDAHEETENTEDPAEAHPKMEASLPPVSETSETEDAKASRPSRPPPYTTPSCSDDLGRPSHLQDQQLMSSQSVQNDGALDRRDIPYRGHVQPYAIETEQKICTLNKFQSLPSTTSAPSTTKPSRVDQDPQYSHQEAPLAPAGAAAADQGDDGQPQDDTPYTDDELSVSQGSTVHGPEKLKAQDLVSRFAKAIVERLNLDSTLAYGQTHDPIAQHHLLEDLRAVLKTFCEAVDLKNPPLHVQSIEWVRRLRGRITQRILEQTMGTAEINPDDEPIGQEILSLCSSQSRDSSFDEIRPWVSAIPFSGSAPTSDLKEEPILELQSSNIATTDRDESLNLEDPTLTWGKNADPTEILGRISKDEAFQEMVRETDRILDLYNGEKLDLIRRRTSLSLRRSRQGLQSKDFRVDFLVDWDLPAFMENNYERGLSQDIKLITSVTGTNETAILCSVGEYFLKQWPKLPATLLDAITLANGKPEKRYQRLSKLRFSSQILSTAFREIGLHVA